MEPRTAEEKWLGGLDALGQQAVWWTAVLAAPRGLPALAAAAPLALVALHLALRPGARARIAGLSAAAAAFGFASDALVARLGFVAFAGAGALPPGWMVALWAVFGVALTASLRSVGRWPLAAMVLAGALAGPLAYRGGAAFGALAFPKGFGLAFAAVGTQWALFAALAFALVPRRRPAPAPSYPGAAAIRQPSPP